SSTRDWSSDVCSSDLLLREELLFITPRLGSLGDSGELVYTTAVFGAVPMADLRRALGDVFLINELQEPPARFLLCRGIDLGDVKIGRASCRERGEREE